MFCTICMHYALQITCSLRAPELICGVRDLVLYRSLLPQHTKRKAATSEYLFTHLKWYCYSSIKRFQPNTTWWTPCSPQRRILDRTDIPTLPQSPNRNPSPNLGSHLSPWAIRTNHLHNSEPPKWEQNPQPWRHAHWTIPSTYPASLSVCHKLRECAKVRYKTISECLSVEKRKFDATWVRFSGLLGVRIDLEHDTILHGPAHVGHLRKHLDLKTIRYLALKSYAELMGTSFILEGTLRKLPTWIGRPYYWTAIWPNLKSLNFILR